MKNLIRVVLIFQLGIFICQIYALDREPKIGDILSEKRRMFCQCGPVVYKHFLVYVGKERFPGKSDSEDIFHITKLTLFGEIKCTFGTLSKEAEFDNYLDKPGDEDPDVKDVRSRVEVLIIDCPKYNLVKNNCEHLATYVRYGKKHCIQPGTWAGTFLETCRKIGRRRRDDSPYPIEYERVSCDDACAGIKS